VGPRLATAAVGIPVILLLILAGGLPFTVAVAIVLAVGAGELCHAAGVTLRDPQLWIAGTGAGLLALAADSGADTRFAVLAGTVAASLVALVVNADVQGGFGRWAAAIAGVTYIGVLGAHLVRLRLLDDGRAWLLLMLFTTFATDTGAFAVGRTIGGRRLAPRVSPGKTVSGAVGGLAAGALACVALNYALRLDEHPAGMALLGAAVAVAGQAGDLAESLLKRSLGVKDMGRIFPGHGGVLDRLDSILFTAPLVYFVVRWIIE
jgi:phosphatidate cytidylyltransferase